MKRYAAKSRPALRTREIASSDLHKSVALLNTFQGSTPSTIQGSTFAILCAFCLIITIISPALAADYPFDGSLYDSEQVNVILSLKGGVTLSGSGSGETLTASVNYYPDGTTAIDAAPKPASMGPPILFSWKGIQSGNYPFGYQANIKTNTLRPQITTVPYPFNVPTEITPFLEPQKITDTNSKIRAQALSLVANTTDSFVAVHTIAAWTEANVKYDLTSITSQASKSSSWVFDNRYGVCDELTSLFISMSREAGIPARFVSGVAYTNLAEFPDHWGPHGWAEVWLPQHGWVPVDVTYGEIGWLDATHITLARDADSGGTAVSYELLARSLSMNTMSLDISAIVQSKSGNSNEPLRAALTPLYEHVGSNSGNLITATIMNDAPYAVATEVYLVTTADTKVLDARKINVLIPARSTRQTSWRITTTQFDKGYTYTLPFEVILQRAGNASTEIYGDAKGIRYPVPQAVDVQTTSIPVTCERPERLYTGEQASVRCTSPGARVCVQQTGGACGQDGVDVTFTGTEEGAFPISISATRGSEKGRAIVTFQVDARPDPTILVDASPSAVKFDDTFAFTANITTQPLTDAAITASGAHFTHSWDVAQLREKGIALEVPASLLDAGTNTLTVTVTGSDKNGAPVTKSATASITLDASWWERIQLAIMHFFG